MINPEFVKIPTLKYYKADGVPDIQFGTSEAACFDLAAHFGVNRSLTSYDDNNIKSETVPFTTVNDTACVYIRPKERVLIPTGLWFDIPVGWSLRVHPRSGRSIKDGLNLINCEGVIDSDYVDEVMITLFNNTKEVQYITSGERLAQAELVPVYKFNTQILNKKPDKKGDRKGGFGSTGK